jgi:two-component system sensor histidine kinase KdpD
LYLGAAPGVGKTYAMLGEGWRRQERGTDVVIGWLEEHGRAQTNAQVRDLAVFPRRSSEYRGKIFEEMDTAGLLARKPQMVLVDELAHTNSPGSAHAKRWQDVEELLDAGINVISTVNLQHLESLNDVITRITGVTQQETLPDRVVRAADQLELVDMAPEALRRRLAHGNVYPPERIDAALSNYFRAGNLIALRELTLLWVADRVDEELSGYRERHGITGAWETKERVMVSLTGAEASKVLIRRAARMAMRSKAELVGVHVRTDDGLSGGAASGLDRNRALLDDLGGRYVEVVGADIAPALVQVALAENATQLVLGATHRSRLAEFVQGSIVNSVIRAASGALDIHVIATEVGLGEETSLNGDKGLSGEERKSGGAPRIGSLVGQWRRRLLSPLPVRRRLSALVIALLGFPLLTLLLTVGLHVGLSTALSSYLLLVVVVAATGGVWPGMLAAAAGFALSTYFFSSPVHTFTIGDARDVLALAMFLITAGVVSVLVDVAARRSATAVAAGADARMLARVAGRFVAPGSVPLSTLLEELMVAFRLVGVAVLRSDIGQIDPGFAGGPDGEPGSTSAQAGWSCVASAGPLPPASPKEATTTMVLTPRELLALRGPGMSSEDRDILAAFVGQLATALGDGQLGSQGSESVYLMRPSLVRGALLAAVVRSLRAPVLAIQADAGTLGADSGTSGSEDTQTLVLSVGGEADRLSRQVESLADLGRLETDSIDVLGVSCDVGEIIAATVVSLGAVGGGVTVALPDALPRVRTDPTLIERALANLVDNSLAHGSGKGVRIAAGAVAGGVDILVIDRGPGVCLEDLDAVFAPFDDSGEATGRVGAGLGLAVAKGLVELAGGELTGEDTPGGGCTMVVRLPVARQGGDKAASDNC